jgi:tRNA-dihydrouridine synthase C
MTLLLAPMEGLLDHTLRDVLTRIGGVERCVSEFVRVTGTLLPERTFRRIVPELLNGGRTRAGVPVRVQLLGSDPACLADNAARVATLSPFGVDLNFGCPAKVVNRHGGGAMLLDDPEGLLRIVAAVRRAVPAALPVTAKMRLGVQDDARAEDCARALEAGGASEIVVHARTRAQAYRPPAYWERIAQVREAVRVPVVANGEIWSVADARRCRAITGCRTLMLGRGIVSDPGLALAILADEALSAGRRSDAGDDNPAQAIEGQAPQAVPPHLGWVELQPHLRAFWAQVNARVEPRHRAGRLKQWLRYLSRTHAQAATAHEAVRSINDPHLLGARFFGGAAFPVGAGRAGASSGVDALVLA